MTEGERLAGRCVLITGGSEGFGFALARACLHEGASVLICARSGPKVEQAVAELAPLAHRGALLAGVPADVSRPADVERLVAAARERLGGLDVLMANAGVYGPKGPVERLNWDEWVRAVEINLNGTVLSCRAVLPHFKAQRAGKIIVLSGGGATKPMPFFSAYAATKAAVVRFVETLAGEVAGFGIDCNSVAPGALNTRLLEEVLREGPEAVGRPFYEASLRQKATGGDSPAQGAALCVFLASRASDGITGRLLSAKWDPWSDLPRRREELRRSDIYTLRRIVPEDRGPGWAA
jgi:NAD(P)-dependent dehydrogenase (short-subunit alcohol dehydrogenase family)